MSLNPVYSSPEELSVIARLHDLQMSDEVLSATIPDLVKVVTYRGDADKHLQLCARQMNTFMRVNYKDFIHNVGRNIFPLIIASDFEPGFEGVGSSFTLYLRDGSQHKIAPTVSSDYEMFKALSHMALCLFILLTPHFDNPKNIAWRAKVLEQRNHIEIFKDALANSSKSVELKGQLLGLASTYTDFIDAIVKTGTFSLDDFLTFTKDAFSRIRVFMAEATMAQARAVLPAMVKWKKMLGPEEWSKVYVMIPTVWPVALNSPRLQLFERLVDADKIATHIITSEFPRNFDECRDTVGRVVGDRAVGRLVFGTADTKAKMKVLALSSRTDVVADDFEASLQHAVEELEPEDAAFVNKSALAAGEEAAGARTAPGCPMQKLRAAPLPPMQPKPLRVARARLLGRQGLWDISFGAAGTIAAIERASDVFTAAHAHHSHTILDACGKTALPGFVDAHVHLDKCYLLDRCCASEGDFPEALRETLKAKESFTVEDIAARARRLIENQIAFGTSVLRAHVEVDPIVGLRAVDALLPLRKEYEWAITIQLCVFAQEGITNQDSQLQLMREALRRGCDVVGSAPYCDPQPERNIDAVFELAAEFAVPVDFHLDYHLEGKQSYIGYVVQQTMTRGWQGRVCLGHMTYLSTLSTAELRAVGLRLKDADVSVLALPASDVCMMARGDTDGNKRRGVCPVDELAAMGVTAAFATNNVQNLFTFTGDGDVLKVGTLLCQLLQLTSQSGANLALDMATTLAAKAIGHGLHKIEIGLRGDLVLVDGTSSMEILAAPSVERIVVKSGVVVSQTTYKRQLSKPVRV